MFKGVKENYGIIEDQYKTQNYITSMSKEIIDTIINTIVSLNTTDINKLTYSIGDILYIIVKWDENMGNDFYSIGLNLSSNELNYGWILDHQIPPSAEKIEYPKRYDETDKAQPIRDIWIDSDNFRQWPNNPKKTDEYAQKLIYTFKKKIYLYSIFI